MDLKITYEERREDGRNRACYTVTYGDQEWTGRNIMTTTNQRSIARTLGITDTRWLADCVRKGVGEYPEPVPPPPPPPTPFPVCVRSLEQTAATERVFSSFDEAVACTDLKIPQPLIYWEGKDEVCAVDMDFHYLPESERPTVEHLTTRFAAIEPAPRYIWVTHGQDRKSVV